MITSDNFKDYVTLTFSFLVTEFKFKFDKETFRENVFYDIQYRDKDKEKVISVSIETIENYFLVILFKLNKGKLPDYDDKTKTTHLTELNNRILRTLDKKDFEENNKYFQDFGAEDEIERQILKSAKDLRLCLKNSEM